MGDKPRWRKTDRWEVLRVRNLLSKDKEDMDEIINRIQGMSHSI